MTEMIDQMVSRGVFLKRQIEEATEELKKINLYLSGTTEFKKGSKTGHLYAAGHKVTVLLKENIKWHQDRLVQVSQHFNDMFFESFETTYKPRTKVMNAYMAESREFAQAIDWCREIKPGAPSVSYEPLEEEVSHAA